MMGVFAVVVFGCLGLAVDIGRMYVAKIEAQAYADSAALAGAPVLNGTSAGVTNASTAATSVGNTWNFDTTSFSGTTVDVTASASGPWTNASSPPGPATNYTYLHVTATAPVSLYFMPVVTAFASGSSPSLSTTVTGQAVAAHLPVTTVAGQQYTIRYPANGSSECTGDTVDSSHTTIGSARGYWGDNSAAVISQQVQGSLQEEGLTVGEVLPGVGGAKTTIATDIVDRVDQDGDTTDDTYSAYTSYGHTGNSIWSAIYIGAGIQNNGGQGASSTPGSYQVKLVQ